MFEGSSEVCVGTMFLVVSELLPISSVGDVRLDVDVVVSAATFVRLSCFGTGLNLDSRLQG